MNGARTRTLRTGWTTGACAAAAAKAAYYALVTGEFPDPIEITLPKGQRPAFALACEQHGEGYARAGIIKDAGDDPDVTHGATVLSTVRRGPPGSGVRFFAGPGVGTVTRPGLPIPPGEPAINPVPRRMIVAAIAEVAELFGAPTDVEVEVSIPGGERLAEKTMNPRLGIIGGLSVLGTTGIVRPFSCASWIASIHRGIDVARATGLTHVVGATGSTSEAVARARHSLPEEACLDMGDFVGGTLKYLRAHPVPRLTLAGGVGKFTKLAQGALDLHSGRSRVDFHALALLLEEAGGPADLVASTSAANTAKEVFDQAANAGIDLGGLVARRARMIARSVLRDAPVDLEVIVIDRSGEILGVAGFDKSCGER